MKISRFTVSAYPLLSAYCRSVYHYKRIRLLTRVYSRIASDGEPTNDYKDITVVHILYSKLVTYNLSFVAMQSYSYRLKCHCLPEMNYDYNQQWIVLD